MTLEALIKKRIRAKGPISIADYMQLALAHPEHGYYMRRDPLGAAGDFTTAPEISQVFGELVGLWVARQWEAQGKPAAALVELGPGRGTLMADALRATKKIAGFHEAVSVHLVETSPVLKQKQWHALAGKHPRIEWHESVDTLPRDTAWLAIANEFFDALPIRQFVVQDGTQTERRIGLVDNQLHFLPTTNSHQPTTITETCEPAQTVMATLAKHIAKHAGSAIVIDYGYAEGKGDTLQAVKDHAFHPVLETPGEADLTAHVDFAALAEAARKAGAAAHGPVPQGRFLMQIGAGVRVQKLCATATAEQGAALIAGLDRLASPEQMGDLFKVLAVVPKGRPAPEGFA